MLDLKDAKLLEEIALSEGLDITDWLIKDCLKDKEEGEFVINCLMLDIPIEYYISETEDAYYLDVEEVKEVFDEIIAEGKSFQDCLWRKHSKKELMFFKDLLEKGKQDHLLLFKENKFDFDQITLYERLSYLKSDKPEYLELIKENKYPSSILYEIFSGCMTIEEADEKLIKYAKYIK